MEKFYDIAKRAVLQIAERAVKENTRSKKELHRITFYILSEDEELIMTQWIMSAERKLSQSSNIISGSRFEEAYP